jgi:hypothetical protein
MRLATMVQMLGVIVLALGLEQMFASMDEGGAIDNRVMVAGYVVMRVPMIFLWARAARDDPARRPSAITYIWTGTGASSASSADRGIAGRHDLGATCRARRG